MDLTVFSWRNQCPRVIGTGRHTAGMDGSRSQGRLPGEGGTWVDILVEEVTEGVQVGTRLTC